MKAAKTIPAAVDSVNNMESGKDYRIVGELKNTDKIMHDSFWVGVYPGMESGALDYMVDCIKQFAGVL